MNLHRAPHDATMDVEVLRLSLASPETIRSWSSGEVKQAKTIQPVTYRQNPKGPRRRPTRRAYRFVKDGLFCEQLFGPADSWQCACGRFRGLERQGRKCPGCGVTVASNLARRRRMGHIELAMPVVHCWFFKLRPNRLAALLGIKPTQLEKVIYGQRFIVLDPGPTPLKVGQVLTDIELGKAKEEHGKSFVVGTGGKGLHKLLKGLDVQALARRLRTQVVALCTQEPPPARLAALTRRLRIVEALARSDNRPEWMVLECLPVLPPDLRPLTQLQARAAGGKAKRRGRFAAHDLNDHYKRILHRNNRLKDLKDRKAPEVIIRNEARLLQQAVDALFLNEHCKPPVFNAQNRPLRSLTSLIQGKQGRFRQNLLGKRVDFSARSVIVAGPQLKLHQCGLPKVMALELYRPFVIRRLLELDKDETFRSAVQRIERRDRRVWDALAAVVQDRPVLLNRAPTLHRLGVQAFEPVLIEGKAIQLHPLVCKGFNADFDGDQMGVHLPLSIEAQVEARVLMMAAHNFFSPANGQLVLSPNKDIVLGCYYLTADLTPLVGARSPDLAPTGGTQQGQGMVFGGLAEVLHAHAQNKVGIHAGITVRLPEGKRVVGQTADSFGGRVPTTVGRVLFNDLLHPRMPFYNLPLTFANLERIVVDCHKMLGRHEAVQLLDRIKQLGFREATRSGLSFTLDALRPPSNKAEVIRNTERAVAQIERWYQRGLMTAEDRDSQVLTQWTKAIDAITARLMKELRVTDLNPVALMAESGARCNAVQIRQLAGLRGLMPRPSSSTGVVPILASFREGLSLAEYFISIHGARKAQADSTLRAGTAGYLTRKLVDIAQNVVVTLHDCGTKAGITGQLLRKGQAVHRPLSEAIRGRVSRTTIDVQGRVVVRENELITAALARRLEEMGVEEVAVRSPLTCAAPRGVCRLCYGMDLATEALVDEGQAVGIIAAQSIGEPGTQFTFRIFHGGGVKLAEDIAADLPRVNRLFEGRVAVPDQVQTQGPEAVGEWLVPELQKVYRGQRLVIDDKHFEIVVAQMLRRVRVRAPGDTALYPEQLIDRHAFAAVNRHFEQGVKRKAEGRQPATGIPVLLGITEAVAESESFLASASFQDAANVLADAALAGQTDPLLGLKENVMRGGLIPAGTGWRPAP